MVVNAVRGSNYAYGRPITQKNLRTLWEKVTEGVCENTQLDGNPYRSGMVEIGEAFVRFCPSCSEETQIQRVLTRKAAAELRRRQAEADLRQSILDRCAEYGFQCRFLNKSAIITTPLSDWCFDYHTPKKTLYHESTTKINFTTGDYAKDHVQFRDRRMSPIEVIDYIANHDLWKATQVRK